MLQTDGRTDDIPAIPQECPVLRSATRFASHTQWSNYSIIYDGALNMASDSEPRKFFLRPPRGPQEVTFRAAKSISISA